MSFFDVVIFNSISVLFPFLVYIVFLAYSNLNKSKKYNDSVFELTLISSMYLIIRLSSNTFNNYSIVFINIPLIFSYLKKKNVFSIFLSIFLTLYFVFSLKYNINLIMIEYICYYIVIVLINRNNREGISTIKIFTLIKSFFFSLYIYHINGNINVLSLLGIALVTMVLFYFFSILYYFLLRKAEDIISLNSLVKELEKEKTLRNSLFKLTHEIKNPIAVCKGYLDMMNLDDYDTSKKYIKTIKSEIERTLVIMDDFLDYSKIKVDKDIMDINLFIEETLEDMKIIFNKNGINLDINIGEDEVFINGDYNRLKQVFINILKNAIEARIPNKDLNIKIISKVEEESICIIITDNGKGMTKKELDNLGEAFYTTKNKGTGLGVLLCKDIIKLHDGSLVYNSEEGKGTDVIIKLPIIEI